MNSRERFLSILVGALVVGLIAYWGVNSFRDAIDSRRTALQNKRDTRDQMFERRMAGEFAARQMGEYRLRSLPSDPDEAGRVYGNWLLESSQDHGFDEVTIEPVATQRSGDLFHGLSFIVRGRTDVPSLVNWMHDFYSKDYLHRIRSWSLRPSRTGDYRLDITVDAMAMSNVPTDLPPPGEQSYRITDDLAEYRQDILNRNFFEPPNQPPRFTGNRTVEVRSDREATSPLTFEDPEGHRLEFELVEAPEGKDVRLDASSGTLRVRDEVTGSFPLKVRVRDDGYPSQVTEAELLVRVSDPPEPPPPPKPPLKFDDAKQTVLTGLVGGSNDLTAWLKVRTRDETLKLRRGDSFEIGSIQATVADVQPHRLVIEVDGKRYDMKPTDKLRDVVPESVAPNRDAESPSDPTDPSNVADVANARDSPNPSEEPTGKPTDAQPSTDDEMPVADASSPDSSDADAKNRDSGRGDADAPASNAAADAAA